MEAFTIQGTIELQGLNQATQGLKGLEKQATSSSQSLQSMGKSMTVAGVAITASLGMMVKSFVSTGSELRDLSTITNIGAGRLAGYKYAAEQNSSSLSDFEAAIKRTSTAITEAKNNTGESTKAFDLMGLKIEELEGLSPQKQFEKIASAIAKIPDPIQRSATAVAVFGRSGTFILPTLINQFEQTVQKGEELSGWTDEMADKADALGDAFGTLKTAGEGLFNQIGSALAPALQGLANATTTVTTAVTNFSKEHSTATGILANFGLSLGTTMTAVGTGTLVLSKMSEMAKSLGTNLGSLAFKLGGITAIVTTIITTGMTVLAQKGAYDTFNDSAREATDILDKYAKGSASATDVVTILTIEQMGLNGVINDTGRQISEWMGFESLSTDQLQAMSAGLTDQIKKFQELEKAEQTDTAAKQANIAATQAIIDAANDLISSWQYENSVAGKLGVSMEDIYKHLLDLGWGTERITELYENFGLETKNLDALLSASEITIFDVRDAYKELTAAALESAAARREEAMAGLGGAIPEELGAEIGKRMMLLGAGIGTQSEFSHYYTALQEGFPWIELPDLPSFGSGGTVPGAIGEPQLAIVHGGEKFTPYGERGPEAVVPLNQMGKVVNITIHNAGSVVTTRDIVSQIRESFNDVLRNTSDLRFQ